MKRRWIIGGHLYGLERRLIRVRGDLREAIACIWVIMGGKRPVYMCEGPGGTL
jgi:hypothetical protein